MTKFKNGQKVMADYKVLQRRPDGRTGLGGPLVLYGIQRITGIITTISNDYVWIAKLGSNWTIKVKKVDVMVYDKNNDTLPGTGNSMYDNDPIDYSENAG